MSAVPKRGTRLAYGCEEGCGIDHVLCGKLVHTPRVEWTDDRAHANATHDLQCSDEPKRRVCGDEGHRGAASCEQERGAHDDGPRPDFVAQYARKWVEEDGEDGRGKKDESGVDWRHVRDVHDEEREDERGAHE